MQLKKQIAYGIMFICILALWTDSAQAGSSFLSPSQKPQGKSEKKPVRVGKRFSEGLPPPFEALEGENKHVLFTFPFEMGITMNEEEFQEYGNVLQRIVQDVLTDGP
ncbi:ghrelin/obestatin prepropeptide [Brienomyrus brachyistius]|uniref:ghrelin/obestatin prepropeptide n=1 Tax=Brienomyrus brachyistius TaxID=42636 RepID=UPI0020B3CEC7|nr:ghrelin/obestatin prepropeptide [Brienomyrus brachyistius]